MIVYSEKKYIWQSFHNKAGGKRAWNRRPVQWSSIIGQGIYDLEWVLGKMRKTDLSTNDERYNKEALKWRREEWSQKDLLANYICHLLIWQCFIKRACSKTWISQLEKHTVFLWHLTNTDNWIPVNF